MQLQCTSFPNLQYNNTLFKLLVGNVKCLLNTEPHETLLSLMIIWYNILHNIFAKYNLFYKVRTINRPYWSDVSNYDLSMKYF